MWYGSLVAEADKMWYATPMPEELPRSMMKEADLAVKFARDVRKRNARNVPKSSPQRTTEIQLALDRLKEVMDKLRPEIHRFPYGPQTPTADQNRQAMRVASAEIQRERRKLWKMKERKRDDFYDNL